MILLTTGTNEQPFDRLVRAAGTLPERERLVVQFGSSQLPHGHGEWIEFTPFEHLAALMREARVVVCHAGVGSIMLARKSGHQPIVVPRRRHLGEAVDDHQLELARRLHAGGLVRLVEQESELAEIVGAPELGARDAGPNALTGAAALCTDIGGELSTLALRRVTRAAARVGG